MKISHKLAGIFACFTLLIIGSIVLLSSMTFDYNAVINACKYSILGAVVSGVAGYIIGEILSKAPQVSRERSAKKRKESAK